MQKELNNLAQLIKKNEALLSNKNFLKNAPEKIVMQNKNKIKEYQEKVTRLKELLKNLETM
ncbi:MAG TPA: hypothetical protein ENL05_01580 [Candidatus Moranbacteria bacterium]|nr:hypothetical protein [Candidatus Moranbacteria bacterium]